MKNLSYEFPGLAIYPSPDFALQRKITLSPEGRGVDVGETLLWEAE